MPSVILDRDANIFEMSGRSIPENALEFYRPILRWLDEYSVNPLPKTEFVFKMGYYNTATAKQILEILLRLEDMYNAGHEVRVVWLYENGDSDVEDAGVEMSHIVNVPLVISSFEDVHEQPSAKAAKDDYHEPLELKKNDTYIVTISRELGAGGRLVGQLLAERLNLSYFDLPIIEALTDRVETEPEIVNKSDKTPWWKKDIRALLSSSNGNREIEDNKTMTDKQSAILKSIAQNESCIVANPTAFFTFKDYPNHINIFICASEESRISKLMSREGISREDAVAAIDNTAKERDMYVMDNTGLSRHDTRNYDLVLNMDKITEGDAVSLIIQYIEIRKKYFSIIMDTD